MPEFTTRFEGLVVHANLGSKWFSAMMAADDHHAVLAVPTNAIKGTSTLPTTKSGNDEETWFDIEGEIVRSDLPSGTPTKDPTFDVGIAQLSKVATPPNSAARLTAQTNSVDTAAFNSLFELPAGQLFAVEFFARPAIFGNLPDIRCVAQAVELASNTIANTVTFRTSSGSVTLDLTKVDPTKASVRLQNVSPDSVMGPHQDNETRSVQEANDHFRFYSRFFSDSGVVMQAPVTTQNFRCDKAGRVGTRFSVECSNTQYP